MQAMRRARHWPLILLLLVGVFVALAAALEGATPQERFFEACEKGDAVGIRRAIALGADVSARDALGRTALMAAAKSGKLAAVQALLWAGAKASERGADGRTAYEQMPPPPPFQDKKALWEPYEQLMLTAMLRCHQFLEEEGHPKSNVSRPSYVLINEPTIDYLNPPIRNFYWVNTAGKTGVPGKDGDGNEFAGDVYGWNEVMNAPYALTQPQIDLIQKMQRHEPFLARILDIHNRAMIGGAAEKQAEGALMNDFNNPDVELFGRRQKDSDLDYLWSVLELAHGSHVANIIGRASHGKVLVHGLSWGRFGGSTEPLERNDTIIAMARECSSMEQFLDRYIIEYRRDQIAHGRTVSRYLKASGAGVVNISMGVDSEGPIMKSLMIVNIAGKKVGLEWHSPGDAALKKLGQFVFDFYCHYCLPWTIMFGENPNVLFVPSAGNADGDNPPTNTDAVPAAPAVFSVIFPNVITIAATDHDGKIADFSFYGATSVNMGAPGVNILAPTLGGFELYMSGTSMAAPAVAGTAAELRLSNPKLTARQVREILEYSGKPEETLRGKTSSGRNLDGAQAMAAAAGKGDRVAAANYFREQGRLREATAEVDAGMAVKPTGDLWAQRGWIAMDSDDAASARNAFGSGLQLEAHNRACLEGRAISALLENDWAERAADAEILVADYPDSVTYNSWRAFALLYLGDGARAIPAFAALADVLKREGRWPNPATLLGWSAAHWLTGNAAEAQRLYRQVDASVSNPDELQRDGWTDKEIALVKQVADSITPPAIAKLPVPPKFIPPPDSKLKFPPDHNLIATNTWQLPENADTEPKQDASAMKAWIQKEWDAGYAITSIGGFPEHWRVVMSKNSGLYEQYWLTTSQHGALPETKIAEHHKAGRAITGVAGDFTNWFLVFSKGTTFTDQRFNVVGPFPDAFISRFGSTHRITGVAGSGYGWVTVMSRGTPVDERKQEHTEPGNFSTDWEHSKWNIHTRYTLVAGDGNPDDWVSVTSDYPTEAQQIRMGPVPFPTTGIRGHWAEGKRIVSIAGTPKSWVVVMEDNTGFGDQAVW